ATTGAWAPVAEGRYVMDILKIVLLHGGGGGGGGEKRQPMDHYNKYHLAYA
ncbi:hypothetical protein ACJX0J_008624, partial [Zea mays]